MPGHESNPKPDHKPHGTTSHLGDRVGIPFNNAIVEVPDTVDLRPMQVIRGYGEAVQVAKGQEAGYSRGGINLTRLPTPC